LQWHRHRPICGLFFDVEPVDHQFDDEPRDVIEIERVVHADHVRDFHLADCHRCGPSVAVDGDLGARDLHAVTSFFAVACSGLWVEQRAGVGHCEETPTRWTAG
jgi:hypothetical protein